MDKISSLNIHLPTDKIKQEKSLFVFLCFLWKKRSSDPPSCGPLLRNTMKIYQATGDEIDSFDFTFCLTIRFIFNDTMPIMFLIGTFEEAQYGQIPFLFFNSVCSRSPAAREL